MHGDMAAGCGFEVTRFTASNPTRLSKRYMLKNGELVKESGGMLIEGEAERIHLPGLAEFAQLLTSLTPAHALAYGINGHDHAHVVAKDRLETVGGDRLPVIARTRDHMAWPEGGGVLLGDYDSPDDEESLTPEELLDLLYGACPALRGAPHLYRPSASSCIVNTATGEELRGVNGQRVYVLVKDASDIPRAGQVFFDRLWLAGKGGIKISASGGMLLRSPLDASVFQPERLDFAGGAECVPPLTQRLPPPQLFNPDAEPLDTRAALPDLTAVEQAKVVELQTAAKALCAPQAATVRARWTEARLNELAKRHPNTPKARLREVVKQATEGRVLGPEFILYDSGMQAISVAELLADPGRWHGHYLRDPLEPEYGSSVAWVNLQGKGGPYIFSHAHGLNARYELSLARATIELKSGDLPKVVTDAIAAMREDGLLFEHGGELVRLADGGMEPIKAEWLRIHLGRLIHFTKYDGRRKAVVKTDCPPELAHLVLAQRGAWGLPKLRGAISAPILRLDGSVLQDRGFDPATGLYLTQTSDVRIEAKPSKAKAIAALERLWFPFAQFPFVGPVDRGVFLAGLFTAVMRTVLPSAPAIAVDAPAAGSGKTLLTTGMALLAGVSDPAMMPPVVQEDELRKRLLSALRMGKAVIMLDNQVERLDSAALCAFLTSATYSDRVLGQSLMLEYPNTALFTISGNNIRLVGDLARRVLTCRIDARMERPDKRAFDLDPAEWVGRNRQELVGDVLTLLRGYQQDPIGRRGRGRMASFEVWDDLIRQAVIWAGELGVVEVDDPLDAIDLMYAQDPERAKLAALLAEWFANFGDKPTKVAEVIDACSCHLVGLVDAKPDLRTVLMEIAGEGRGINPRRLGRWIEKNQGSIINGLWFERGPERNHVATWLVRPESKTAQLIKLFKNDGL